MDLIFNNKQTVLTDELYNSLHKEVQEQLLDYITNVPFINNLISPNRKYAKDVPRDEKGRIIVDLVNPHILEDTDYFRPSALHYIKYGKYTNLRPNSNPNSDYGKWIREEIRRCWEGYVRESDGEWIPGNMYFFLNYCPITLTEKIEGKKAANRVVSFPRFYDGNYLRFHYIEQARYGGKYNNFIGGQHAAELASRRRGKSYSMAAILGKNFILGENKLTCERVSSMIVSYNKNVLNKGGTLNMFQKMIDHCAENTQFPSRRLKSSINEMNWVMGYVDLNTGVNKGTLNEVIGIAVGDDEDKTRGKGLSFLGIEEFGNFPRLLGFYNAMLPSVQEGVNAVYGQIVLIGTAGNDEADFASAQELMYNPLGYNLYSLPNFYDKSGKGRNKFVYFYPAFLNEQGFYDEDGNSDVIGAIIEILKERLKVKYNTTDPNSIVRAIAERPITPSEAILRGSRNVFPVIDAQSRLDELTSNPDILNSIRVVDLGLKDGKVIITPSTKTPIRDYPTKSTNMEGAVELFEMPLEDRTGKVFSERYIIGVDPVDDDSQDEGLSLCSCFVLDLWTDRIVAEYTGRPVFADDFYEIVRRLSILYNARINYENNKKGLFGYFSKMNSLWMLTDTLDFLKDKDMVKGQLYGNKSKGVNATAPVNAYATTLIRNWLLKPIEIQGIDEQGNEIITVIPNIMTINSKALLNEIVLYNEDGNFDRVSALRMLMLLREDKMILYQNDITKANDPDRDSNYLGNDKFFTLNYRKSNNLKIGI